MSQRQSLTLPQWAYIPVSSPWIKMYGRVSGIPDSEANGTPENGVIAFPQANSLGRGLHFSRKMTAVISGHNLVQGSLAATPPLLSSMSPTLDSPQALPVCTTLPSPKPRRSVCKWKTYAWPLKKSAFVCSGLWDKIRLKYVITAANKLDKNWFKLSVLMCLY